MDVLVALVMVGAAIWAFLKVWLLVECVLFLVGCVVAAIFGK